MTFDARDEIWKAAYETYYAIYFEEMVSDELISTWQIVDEITKVAVAITATGSAVAGWALWDNLDFKWIWTGIAAASALLSIVHSAFAVQGRLKAHGDNRRFFSALRIDIETFRYRMQVNPDFPIDAYTKELVELRKRYGLAIDRIREDILLTSAVRTKVQGELNERIADKIAEPTEG
jgi:hypothetical protein